MSGRVRQTHRQTDDVKFITPVTSETWGLKTGTLKLLPPLMIYSKSGVESTKRFSLSFGKMSKILTCPPLFMPVQDIWTTSILIEFCLSFGKVPKIFTCPPPFLPVRERRTVSNFHPCFKWCNNRAKERNNW